MSAPLIIDTDAGYDDLLAILYLLGDPNISIQAITTVYGLTTDLPLGGNVLRYMLEQTGHAGIPVYLGSETPSPGGHRVPQGWNNMVAHLNWPAPKTPPSTGAVAYLAEQISGTAPPQILALGPFTNIAAALSLRQPHDALQIRMMGGAFSVNGQPAPGNMGAADPPAPQSEFNVYIDPPAAGQVFAKIPDILVVPLNACGRVPIHCQFISDFDAIPCNASRTVLAKAVLNGILADNKPAVEAGHYFAWDPLAAELNALGDFLSVTVTVDDLGVTSSSTPGPIKAALAADAAQFRTAFFGRFS